MQKKKGKDRKDEGKSTKKKQLPTHTNAKDKKDDHRLERMVKLLLCGGAKKKQRRKAMERGGRVGRGGPNPKVLH